MNKLIKAFFPFYDRNDGIIYNYHTTAQIARNTFILQFILQLNNKANGI
ncbi:hypothetical protein BTN50_1748 (plasmid) [Candidatus Enterovibrio altilux]|uniref:Uncharacterized protein n=1 Tax=Candidatus Enterovibrio altilux TaxID=1927128 RepID=A0A291BAZ2_9GAMM|nr:hypothetical protein BTN50_1748 [Candidatus Enterovibrio luxaltus]